MKLLAEHMAGDAFEAVRVLRLGPTQLGEVTSVAKRVPALLLSNGLAATLVTLAGKRDHGWDEYRTLFTKQADLSKVLHDATSLRDLSAVDYLRMSRAASLWAGWLKRTLTAETVSRRALARGRDDG
jgi:CRISPR/Cas system CMR-associated protein Cmr5 small subunit